MDKCRARPHRSNRAWNTRDRFLAAQNLYLILNSRAAAVLSRKFAAVSNVCGSVSRGNRWAAPNETLIRSES